MCSGEAGRRGGPDRVRDDRRSLRPATVCTPSSVRSGSERVGEEEAVAGEALTANLVLADKREPVGFPQG